MAATTFAARMDGLAAERLLTTDTLDRILNEVEAEITAALRAEITATDAAALVRLRNGEG